MPTAAARTATRAAAAASTDLARALERRAACSFIAIDTKSAMLAAEQAKLDAEEEHRRRGFASALLQRAAEELEAAGEPAFAHVVEGNVASERCFEKNGWTRVATADWLGFERRSAGG